MNNTLKKFDRKLLKEGKKISQKLEGCDICLSSETYDVFIDTDEIDFDLAVKQIMEDQDVSDTLGEMYNKFIRKNSAEIEMLENIISLRKCKDRPEAFKNYDLVKDYLKKFEFTELEQAEVLAYYFNITLNFIFNSELQVTEKLRSLAEKRLKQKMGGFMAFISKSQIDAEVKNLTNNLKAQLKNCRRIRDIIDEKGNLLANKNATDYRWIFEETGFLIGIESIDIILKGSEEKYRLITKEKEEKRQIELAKEKAKQESAIRLEKQQNERKLASKERRYAIQELKKYLENDYPIRYINAEELVLIEQLLKIASYSVEQILAIKKVIIENNSKISNEEAINAYNLMLKEYLSVEEIDIITSAETILSDSEAIKNEFYNTIAKTILEIKDLLIILSTSQSSDDIEFLKLYIEELRNDVINYNLSDYRSIERGQKRVLETE